MDFIQNSAVNIVNSFVHLFIGHLQQLKKLKGWRQANPLHNCCKELNPIQFMAIRLALPQSTSLFNSFLYHKFGNKTEGTLIFGDQLRYAFLLLPEKHLLKQVIL